MTVGTGRLRLSVVAALLFVLAAIPLALIVSSATVGGYPISTNRASSLTLLDALEGRLSFSTLWALHNEHRIPPRRLLLLAIALPTHWDLRNALAVGIVCALGLSSLLAALAWLTMRLLAPNFVPNSVPSQISPGSSSASTPSWRVASTCSVSGGRRNVATRTPYPESRRSGRPSVLAVSDRRNVGIPSATSRPTTVTGTWSAARRVAGSGLPETAACGRHQLGRTIVPLAEMPAAEILH